MSRVRDGVLTVSCHVRWALTNPHLSLHIPSESRISVSTQRKRNGHPRRPGVSLTSIVSNLHVLLRVPSFARWPLTLHLFRPEVLAAWEKWCASAGEPLRDTLDVVTDFGPGETADGQPAKASDALAEAGTWETTGATEPAPWGIHALPLDYAPMKEYVAKGHSIASFEREGDCVVCGEAMPSGEGLYPICSTEGCEGVGHLDCWSKRLLGTNSEGAVLPVAGTCPKCGGEVRWGDMMTELTLRLRGQKEVEKLLRKKRAAKSAKTT